MPIGRRFPVTWSSLPWQVPAAPARKGQWDLSPQPQPSGRAARVTRARHPSTSAPVSEVDQLHSATACSMVCIRPSPG